jgi:cyclophilin family peptidyl-prolyl cis-trans isomerase
MNVTIDGEAAGRIVYDLDLEDFPLTSANFRSACVSEKEVHPDCPVEFTFRNSRFHRVVDGCFVHGGDITKGDGSGGYSVYGPFFADENPPDESKKGFRGKHQGPGDLCSANRGPNHNDSQFYITLSRQVHLDGLHTVFGKVSKGMDVVEKIAAVPVDIEDKPIKEVLIVECGYISQYGDALDAAGNKVDKDKEGEEEAEQADSKEEGDGGED